MMAAKRVTIDVVVDTVCPWCYVGKKRLETALSRFPDVQFTVRWFPYQLAPTAPVEGRNKLEMYNEKFGAARVAQMMPMMAQTFSQLGLKYSVGGLTGNTLDSHRLIHWAGQVGGPQVQNALVEELFSNYFCEEKYINDRSVLVAAAEKAGLQGAAEYLADSNNGLSEVKQLLASKARGISGVPNFTIANTYQVSGAQPPEEFESIIRSVLDKQ
mmetsp:Transcript_12720/g.27557  ORF Transcript_12720/g.27557 Transcript_12720/m.27557 type:complete len:214 (+) Transcript_12720:94-735(+)